MREGEMSCRVLAAAAVAFEVAALSAGAMPLFSIRITSFAACALDLCLKRLTRLAGGPPLPPRSSSEDEFPGGLCRAMVLKSWFFFSLFGFSFSSLRKKGRGGRESENDVENLNLVLSLFFCSCFGIDQPRRGEQPHTNHAGSPGTRHPHSRLVSNTEGRWPGALVERKSEGAVVLAPVPLARLLSEEMRGKTKTMSTQGFCPKAPFRLPSAPSLRQGDIVFLSAQLGRGQGAV